MNVFKVEFRKIFKGLMVWAISLCLILTMYLAFFPSMADAGFDELASAKMEMFPEAFKKAFGLEDMPNFAIYNEYVAYIMQFVMLGVCAYALILGFRALSSEEQEKTIEFQMANPISRAKLVFIKMLVGFLALTIIMITLLITGLIGGELFANTEYMNTTLTVFKMSMIPAYVYMFIGFMLSALLKKNMSSTGTALGIFFGTYLIGIMAGVVEKIEYLKYVSPANYVMATEVLKSNLVDITKKTFDMTGVYIGMALIVISIITTFLVYNKKDMEI